MKISSNLYIISNILFILSTIACIYLYPNTIEAGYLGFLFIFTYLLHSITTLYFFIIKDEVINNNIIQNIVAILLYLYIILITSKYKITSSNNVYGIDILYFKVNYAIASISLLSLTLNKIIARAK